MSRAFSKLGISDDELVEEMADAYQACRDESLALISGAIDTITYLLQQGVKMALITNGSSDMQRDKIDRFGLESYFDFILVEGEFGAGKPDESIFSTTLNELAVSPTQAWMVGDDLERDVAGAQRLGIYGIWVDWRSTGLPASTHVQPDKIIKSLTELLSEDDLNVSL